MKTADDRNFPYRLALRSLLPDGLDLVERQKDGVLTVHFGERSDVPEEIYTIEPDLEGFKMSRLTVAVSTTSRHSLAYDPAKVGQRALVVGDRVQKGGSAAYQNE